MTELVRCEAPSHPRSGSEAAELDPDSGGRPGPTASRSVDHAEQRADRQPLALCHPGAELLEAPLVHADLPPAPALAAADEDRATVWVEIALAERQRLLDAKPATPEDDDHGAQTSAVATTSNLAHHGDDLLDARRVGRIAHSLVAWRSSGVVAGHRRRRATPPGGIEDSGFGHEILLLRRQRIPTALPGGPATRRVSRATRSAALRRVPTARAAGAWSRS